VCVLGGGGLAVVARALVAGPAHAEPRQLAQVMSAVNVQVCCRGVEVLAPCEGGQGVRGLRGAGAQRCDRGCHA
jgi:hypothetical protein